MNNSILNFIATCVAFVSLSVNAEFTELLDVGYKHSSASEKNAQAKIAAKKQEQVTQQLVTQCAAAHAEIKKQSKASGGKAAASYPCDSDFMSYYYWGSCYLDTNSYGHSNVDNRSRDNICTSRKKDYYLPYKELLTDYKGNPLTIERRLNDAISSIPEAESGRMGGGYTDRGHGKYLTYVEEYEIPLLQCWIKHGPPPEYASDQQPNGNSSMPQQCTPEIMAQVENSAKSKGASGASGGKSSNTTSKSSASDDLVGKPCKWMVVTDEESCNSRACFYDQGQKVAVGSKAYICNYSKWELFKDCVKDSLGDFAIKTCTADIAKRYGTPQTREVPAQKLYEE